jgi:hypothetical protein
MKSPAPSDRAKDMSSPAASDRAGFSAELKGKDLLGPDGSRIGNIDEVAGDTLIVSVGGFLGIGEHKVALTRSQVTVTGTAADMKATTSMTKDELKAMPEHKAPAPASAPAPAGR